MKPYYLGILAIVLFVSSAHAVPDVKYRVPDVITTTVGKLTTVQIDVTNTGFTTESYSVTINAALPNEIDITSSDIHTQPVNSGGGTSIVTTIRTLTESDNVLAIRIYQDSSGEFVSASIPVRSRKLSMPEFGLFGFLQITIVAALAYMIAESRLRPSHRK